MAALSLYFVGNTVAFRLGEKEDAPRTSVIIDDFSTVALTFADGNDTQRVRVGFHEQSSAVSVHDERGKTRVSLRVMGGLQDLASAPSVL